MSDHAALLYPRPGEPAFDDDAAFEKIPIFPGHQSDVPVRAGDREWTLPLAWHREYETRPLSYLTFKFNLSNKRGQDEAVRSAELCVKRCFYLIVFHSRRPLSLTTLRGRLKILKSFGKRAVKEGKALAELDYADLLAAIGCLPWKDRQAVASVYHQLRLWRAATPKTYSMFVPPPSVESLCDDDSYNGLDTENVRDDEGEPLSRTYQPFSDAFVTAAGEFCLSVLDELQPAVVTCLREVMSVQEEDRIEALPGILAGRKWPLELEVTGEQQLRGVGHLCQLACIFILSLVLGPRWSEVSALPLDAVKGSNIKPDGRTLWGLTFKLSQSSGGEWRDWPISKRLADYLNAQRDYVQLLEGEGFRYLWRNHSSIWGSGQPLRQIHTPLVKFADKYGFAELTDGNVHHHRFRKTTARLIVIALHGGPMVLRRLFGHEHLAMTLRYILANESILIELREIAEEEHRRAAAPFIEKKDKLVGGGAKGWAAGIEAVVALADVFVPDGARDQGKVTTDDIIDVVASGPDGLSLKQIIPGLVACFKPRDEPGLCCKHNEQPNVSKCQAECMWHLVMPEYREAARASVASSIVHLRGKDVGSPHWVHYSHVIREKLALFPDLAAEFVNDPIVVDVLNREEVHHAAG
ncbi:site-specific integrase [Muricoccus pecuniae]|uniref:Integrase n=1 Tax=Muricoccus pecuniae TaxID=693023 RepID=A0A840XZV1_9PROT|nr:hypothetical protein [Roseomonas pecuniae]MBB5694378.1 integrase [Roseomonas pecuniae]